MRRERQGFRAWDLGLNVYGYLLGGLSFGLAFGQATIFFGLGFGFWVLVLGFKFRVSGFGVLWCFGALVLCIKPTSSLPVLQISILN